MTALQSSGDVPGTDALSVVSALLAAENAHDVESAVALFADDAVATLAVETRRGKAEIRQWQQELAEGHFHMTLVGTPEVNGDTVRFKNTLALDMFKQMGMDTVDAISEALVRDGKIVSYTFSLTPESAAKLAAR